jgi:tetratricopeptide (TPR) repeat protein
MKHHLVSRPPRTKTTNFPNKIMSQDEIASRIEEALALLDIGLEKESEAIIQSLLAQAPTAEVHSAAIYIFNRLGRFIRASVSADVLLDQKSPLPAEELFRIALAFNFSGRLQEAYEIEKSISPQNNEQSLVRLYGLACKANRLGRHPEALIHLLGCFSFQNTEAGDAHRKIFLDSELSSLWEKIPSIPLTLRQAMRYCNLPFDEILALNESVLPLRCVDQMDMHAMPAKFHALLHPVYATCFEVSPAAEAANPALAAEFAAWQGTVVTPRLDAFRTLRDRIASIVLDQQLTFAQFQAAKGRFGCARNHLVCHLLQSPGASLANLPEIPLLRPLIEELRAQEAECPESFRTLISWVYRDEPEVFLRDVLSEMPILNRTSGYALLAAGCMHYRLGDSAAAIESWSACARKWPLDDAPVMNAAMLLSGEKRWDEATQLINRLPDECMKSMLWKRAHHAISERRTFSLSSKTNPTPRIPTPTFGNLYSGADEEFLVEHKQFTPIVC